MLEQNQKLEDQVANLKKESDKFKVEKTNLTQKAKALENEVSELKAELERKNEELKNNDATEELKKEVEQLTITNQVYLDKINELIEQMNKMDEDGYNSLEEQQNKYAKLKKQYDELAVKAHIAGIE